MPEKTEEQTVEISNKPKRISQQEFEKKVFELSEKGLTSEKIGEALRREGIHSKEFENKISKILGSKYTNPDGKNISEKLERLEKHFAKNKKDRKAMRDRERISAKLRRLRKYLSK